MKKETADLIAFVLGLLILISLIITISFIRTMGAQCVNNPLDFASKIANATCFCVKYP